MHIYTHNVRFIVFTQCVHVVTYMHNFNPCLAVSESYKYGFKTEDLKREGRLEKNMLLHLVHHQKWLQELIP